MTKKKRPSNKRERIQIEKKLRDKEEDISRVKWPRVKKFYEEKENQDGYFQDVGNFSR